MLLYTPRLESQPLTQRKNRRGNKGRGEVNWPQSPSSRSGTRTFDFFVPTKLYALDRVVSWSCSFCIAEADLKEISKLLFYHPAFKEPTWKARLFCQPPSISARCLHGKKMLPVYFQDLLFIPVIPNETMKWWRQQVARTFSYSCSPFACTPGIKMPPGTKNVFVWLFHS